MPCSYAWDRVFPGQAFGPGFSLCCDPSGRGGLGEMVGCALLLVRIEVMRKSAYFSNTCANCAAGGAVAAVGSTFIFLARAL